MTNRADLDAQILAAHARGDAGELVGLYLAEADRLEATGEIDAACFFLTQAYVFALEIGDARADAAHRRLVAYGREE